MSVQIGNVLDKITSGNDSSTQNFNRTREDINLKG